MAVTFGFYNSRNGDRVYNARQMSSIFSGIIKDGVFEHFPEQNQHLHVDWLDGQIGNKVVVGPGRTWLNNTWTDNDSNLVMQLDAPNQDQNIERIDAIVLEINTTNNSDSAANMSETVPGRSNKFVVIKGTEASPDAVRKPELRNGDGIYQHYIALVRISANSEHHYITNMVGANDGTPYIIGAVQSVSTTDVLQSWTQAFNAAIETLTENVPGQLDTAIAAYFNDPESGIYQQYHELEDAFGEYTQIVNPQLTYFKRRRHVWLIDRPVSSIQGDTYTYSRTPQSTSPEHSIYPDFYKTIQSANVRPGVVNLVTVQITSPDVGDIIIGSNGYYAVITTWTLTEGEDASYSMTIQSTGKAITPSPDFYTLRVSFWGSTGGSVSPGCDRTFAEIKAAYDSGKMVQFRWTPSNAAASGFDWADIMNDVFIGQQCSFIHGEYAFEYNDISPRQMVSDGSLLSKLVCKIDVNNSVEINVVTI